MGTPCPRCGVREGQDHLQSCTTLLLLQFTAEDKKNIADARRGTSSWEHRDIVMYLAGKRASLSEHLLNDEIAKLRDNAGAVDDAKERAAALMADAERYRWIRKFGEDGTPHIAVENYLPAPSKDHFRIQWLYEEEADAAIDAAKEKP